MDIGIITSDKDYAFYGKAITLLGYNPIMINKAQQLDAVQGLIICGEDEDLHNSQLIKKDINKEITKRALSGMAVLGIAGGVSFMASCYKTEKVFPALGLMDITVCADPEGQEPFITELNIPALGSELVPAKFKKAPKILKCQPNVGILAVYGNSIVLVRQGDFLACTFYPVMIRDLRVLKYFFDMVKETQA